MMKDNKKGYIIGVVITICLSILTTFLFFSEDDFAKPESVYQIYLNGEKIGLIDSKEELYELINEQQSEIKKKYGVDQVYPPNGFTIEKYTTYDSETTEVDDIYTMVNKEKDFTIKGYTVTLKSKEENVPPKYIYILNKEIFDEAIHNFVTTFVDETTYQHYINGTQPEIIDVGQTINNMFFDETITIKESYISIDEKIYTTSNELTHYLLYGDKEEKEEVSPKAKESKNDETYVVKKGDTIESIAYAHKLNVQEFLIANDSINDANTILAVGEVVSVALIHPQITLVYEAEVVEDQEIPYESETRVDYSKGNGYRQVVQQGITGIDRITKHIQVSNGAENSGAGVEQDKTVTIRSAQKEIISVGKTANLGGNIAIDSGSWAWPTNSGWVITSPFGYRGGDFHEGLDISGTGPGSPIYAVQEGVVIETGWYTSVGPTGVAGLAVIVQHANGYYSIYAHLNSIEVKPGDYISRKQRIGTMGRTGVASGTHLHLSIAVGGPPYNGGVFVDPKRLWNMR